MRTNDERNRRHWSLRAWGLFLGAIACITRGILYLPPVASGREPLPLGVDYLTALIPREIAGWSWQPVWLLGAAWLAVGVAGLVDIVIGRMANVLFLCMVGLMVGWAIGYLAAGIVSNSYAGYATAAFYLVAAGWTEISRRITPSVRLTPALAESRLRLVNGDQAEWLHDGTWVAINPERTEQ